MAPMSANGGPPPLPITRAEERFWKKVDIRALDECWNWKARTNRGGYGWFNAGSSSMTSCRFALKMFLLRALGVEIPRYLYACHTCDNSLCCNPYHLFAGTHLDNMKDRESKGRTLRGAQHGSATISEKTALYIKSLVLDGNNIRTICVLTGVSPAAVKAILENRTWRHLRRE